MIKKLLIANRGEIACRIARTANQMGIATVAVYADADRSALHVAACDEAVHIGPSPATESYLRIDRIIAAAKQTGADAIHPGYGFLSENPALPEACAAAGLVFVGPSAEAMRALGGKAAAKDIAIAAGVPVVPGYQGDKQDAATLAREAARIGYPVMIKAVAGGGGRGMRLVENGEQLPDLLESAQREAKSAFGDGRVLIERVVQRPRHIEVQVFGDTHGNVVHLYERDCTLQRRNQKVIEEAPAPGMSEGLRQKMCGAAVKLAKSVGYWGAGTVEFLVEGGAALDESARWYFIEMNTRLQVEHPVTEAITGLDLVAWQLRVAAGEKLPLPQDAIRIRGHAVEVRLCAEDPSKGFLPSVGMAHDFLIHAPDTVRIETGIRAHDAVSPFYDSMIAKLIIHRPDRRSALSDLAAIVTRSAVPGLATNQLFLARLLRDDAVGRGVMDTGLIGRELQRLVTPTEGRSIAVAALDRWMRPGRSAAAPRSATGTGDNGWGATDAFQLGPSRRQSVALLIDGTETVLDVARVGDRWVASGEPAAAFPGESRCHVYETPVRPRTMYVIVDGAQTTLSEPSFTLDVDDGAASGAVRAPINGRVARLFVVEGQAVAKGDRIAVVEAMKMEHVVTAPLAGTVDKVGATEGAQVAQGALLAHVAG